jgi:tetratricopeptide (TPR) repeat protein
MDKSSIEKFSFIILQIILFSLFLSSKTVKVPQDYSTISLAVNTAVDGDVIEVDDGLYFEKNIIIDKDIHLKSKNLFGAVVDGGKDDKSPIFIIRSRAEIEGFVLKNSAYGIVQRHSPDVTWTAHDMAILDTEKIAIYINDIAKNTGSANVSNIIIDNAKYAFSTNDARKLKVNNCLASNCTCVFAGSNHIEFSANRISIISCRHIVFVSKKAPKLKLPATNEIKLGPDILVLDALIGQKIRGNFEAAVKNIIYENNDQPTDGPCPSILEGMSLNILGDVYYRLENYDKSHEFYRTASLLGKKTGFLEIQWDADYGLAKICEKQNKLHDAIKYYKKSIKTIENVRNRLPLIEYKSTYMQSKRKVYESLVNVLYKLHKKHPSEKYHEQAFYFVESSKARAFLDSLKESEIDLEECLDSDTKIEMKNLLQEIAHIQVLLKKSNLSPGSRKSLIQRLEKKEISLTSLILRIKSRNQYFARLISPQPSDYEMVRDRLLNNKTALIEYYFGKDNVFAFLAAKNKLFMTHLPKPDLIRNLVSNYLSFLTIENFREFRGSKGGVRLFSLLIEPFTPIISKNTNKLIIVPDDTLFYLPFESLMQTKHTGRQEQKTTRFLIENFEISYAPSSSVLMNLVQRRKHESKKMDLLAVASNHSELGLPPLGHAVQEVKEIAKFFQKKKRILLTRNNATEKNVKSMDLKNFKVVHFATHAVLDNRKWTRSSLILKPEKNSHEDSLIQPKDLLNLKFDTDLVVLSACQTRNGNLEKGEGILGMTRAFLYSGAQSVLSSLWKIEDRISPLFMRYFYEYLKKGHTKDSALRLAKLDMLHSKHRHPRFWAAFILTGDPAPVSLNNTL